MIKLNTIEAVLEWAREMRDTETSTVPHLFDADAEAAENAETAAYLAECVLLRQAFERNPGASVDALYAAMNEPSK